MLLIVDLSYGCFSKWPAGSTLGLFLRKWRPKLDRSVVKGQRTVVIIVWFENARSTRDTDSIHLNASGVTKKVDIRGEPASVITEEQVNLSHRNALADRTVPTDGWTLRDSHR